MRGKGRVLPVPFRSPVCPPSRPNANNSRELRAKPAKLVAPSEGSTAQWAKWLADQLRQIPDIQVYDALRLNDLAAKGPVRARAVWTTAQAVLGKDYGSVTVADLLKRFQS